MAKFKFEVEINAKAVKAEGAEGAVKPDANEVVEFFRTAIEEAIDNADGESIGDQYELSIEDRDVADA